MLKSILQGVQEQIRFADSKAALIGLFHTIFFGFMATQADALARVSVGTRTIRFWIWLTIFALYAIATVAAVILTIRCVFPRVGESAPRSWIHFLHIARDYRVDDDQYHRDVCSRSDADWTSDIASQIVINARIAAHKHSLIKVASWWTVVAILLWAGTLIAAML
jgi:hypothetical protein